MKNGSKVGTVPSKNLKTLTDDELNLGHNAALALMRVGIPAAMDFHGSGIIYDGKDNSVERRISLTWLTCKGEAVITASRSANDVEFGVEKVQELANAIAQQYQQHMAQAAAPLGAANDDSSMGPADHSC